MPPAIVPRRRKKARRFVAANEQAHEGRSFLEGVFTIRQWPLDSWEVKHVGVIALRSADDESVTFTWALRRAAINEQGARS
jgi:hypothetical protein